MDLKKRARANGKIQSSPQNPQKDTSGTQIGPRKVIFGHFAFFWYFYLIFPLARALFFKSISTHQKLTPDKEENFSQLLKHLNQRKNTSLTTNFHFYHFQPCLLPSVENRWSICATSQVAKESKWSVYTISPAACKVYTWGNSSVPVASPSLLDFKSPAPYKYAINRAVEPGCFQLTFQLFSWK